MARKFKDIEEARAYVSTLAIGQIIELCAGLLVEQEQAERIVISQEQFNAFFKIRGLNADGERETRGRKRKNIAEEQLFEGE